MSEVNPSPERCAYRSRYGEVCNKPQKSARHRTYRGEKPAALHILKHPFTPEPPSQKNDPSTEEPTCSQCGSTGSDRRNVGGCVTPEAHKRVYEYDGAFKCLDCRAKWGALPGKPTMPPTCPAPSPVIEKARECIECGAEIDTGAVCGACANVQRREDLGL
jgi:hypothetical protein